MIDYLQHIPPILDFEASSLSDCSYPISAGLHVAGHLHYWIIKPREDWIDWSLASQAIHGLKRSHLTDRGIDISQVDRQMRDVLSDINIVYSDNPYWETIWLSRIGQFNLEIRDVRELIPAFDRKYWKLSLEKQFRTHNLTHHRADHDALALALTVYELQNF